MRKKREGKPHSPQPIPLYKAARRVDALRGAHLHVRRVEAGYGVEEQGGHPALAVEGDLTILR